ncbi:MAG: GreA/GreB family elongation factor [Opitutales bacterium]|nr:GreA/GreB family elongation factor [Opitutales bacterium]
MAAYPQLKRQQATLEALEAGAWCCHGSWGVGRIQDVDAENSRIVIQFESQPEPKSMDLAFCLQKLQVLPETHVIVEVRKDPEAAKALLKNDPCEWVVKALQSFPEQQATLLALELLLRQALEPLFKPAAFKSWWVALQRTLLQHPLIRVPKNKADVFALRIEPISRERELLDALLSAKQAAQKITLGMQLCQLPCLEDIRKELPSVLEIISPLIENTQLSAAQRLEACWICSDIARTIDADAEPFKQSARNLVQDAKQLPDLAEKIPHVHHERLMRLLIKACPDDWQEVVLSLLKNGSSGLIDACFGCLVKQKREVLLTETLEKWLQAQNLGGSLLIWLIRHRKVPPFAALLTPLFGTQFLTCVLQAIDGDALGAAPGRRIALAEELNKDTTLIGDLLKNATMSTATDLARLLMSNQGLDDLKKRSLLARFIRIFPELQSFAENPSGKSEETLWVSQAGLETAKAEYATLVNEKIPANKVAIAKARELGDLRENSEYKMARQDQTVLLARKSELEKFINHARVIAADAVKTDKVNIGTKVTLKKASGASTVYTILGAWDSNPDKNIVSYQTPLAQAMLGRAVGESVTLPNGETASVQSIQRFDA